MTAHYGDVIWESSSTDTISYVLGGSHLISQTKNGITSYLLSDGLGSTRMLTMPSGSIEQVNGVNQIFNYSAFGQLTNTDGSNFTGTPNTRYLYTGQQFDSTSNLYSLRARYYNPTDGRFLSRDTWMYDFQNPVELNRYGYVGNNPVNLTDPTGYTSAETGVRIKTSRIYRFARYALGEARANTISGALSGVFGYVIGTFAGVTQSPSWKDATRRERDRIFLDVLFSQPLDIPLMIIAGGISGAMGRWVDKRFPIKDSSVSEFFISSLINGFLQGSVAGFGTALVQDQGSKVE